MALLNESFDKLSLFYENNATVIYKGVRKEDGIPVILKSHKSADQIFRIKHENDLLAGQSIKGAGEVLGVSYNDDRSYLIMEDTGAQVLDAYLEENEVDTATFLTIAQNAAKSLAAIHAAGIVHCDIKPANILVHPYTKEVTFIDFGISFSSQRREAQQNEGFAGTLEFMAPEQTGRLNMKVDMRSDLYSLGITLYYMLTRELPFRGETAVEIIHAQTVLPPAPISQYTAVDPIIEAMVLKLMEKAPKKRYQSAESLEYDVAICLERLNGNKVEPFMLGEKDVLASLEPAQRLFGKEKEVEELAGVYYNTPKEHSALVLLHGPEGSGKSRLLDTFIELVEQGNGYLLRGGFDWKQGGESYTALQEMFDGFELFAYNANLPLPEYKNRLLEELGENAGVLLDIIPSFASILGEQPPVKQLTPVEAAQRARLVLQKTLSVLCDAPYPYVLVFDNAQWADENSLDLLLSAVESDEVGNCIVLLSYQDDPDFLQRISSRVENLDPRTLVVRELVSQFLHRNEVEDLLAELFDWDGIQVRSLADIVYSTTGGEMDKIRLLLQQMYRNRQITYEAEKDEWTLHLENVEEGIMLELENRYKIAFEELDEEERKLLARMACVGEHFDAKDVALAFGLDKKELDKTLEKLEEEWLSNAGTRTDSWAFSQKPLFDLCYAYLSEKERVATHKQIVETLYPIFKDDKAEMLRHSTLFTRQVNCTSREQFDPAILHDISRYKLTAAEEFMRSANMQQAATTFQNGLKLLGEKPFETDYELAFELYLQYALCCFALRDEEKATELLEVALQNARTEDDKYNATFKVVEQYLARAEWENAKLYAKRYLREAGLLLEGDVDVLEAGDKEYLRFVDKTGEDGILVCLDYEFTKDALVEHHGNILIMLAEALLFSLDDKCKYYLYKAANLAVDNMGLFSQFVRVFCVSAARYASIRHYRKAKSLIETGIEFADNFKTGQAFLWCVYGNMISHWVNPQHDLPDIYKKAKYHALLEGNAFYEAYADMMLLNYHSFLGENLNEYHAETMATLRNLERTGMQALQANFVTFRQYARCLLGRTMGSDSFDDAQFTEDSLKDIEGTWFGTFNEPFYYVYRMRACYIHLHFREAVEYAEKYLEHAKKYNMTAYLTHVQFYYYYSMSLLELCRLYPEERDVYLPRIKENQIEQKRIAKLNPLNFEFKHMLVENGIKGLDYQGIELVEELSEIHKGFMRKGLMWDVIFTERLVGNFWKARGIPQYEIIHKNNRLVHYKDIGAKVCIRILGEPDEDSLMRKREAREREEMRGKRGQSTYSSSTMTGTSAMATSYATRFGTAFSTAYGSTMMGSRSHATGLNATLDFEALLSVLERLIGLETMPLLAGELSQLLLQNGNADKVMLFLYNGSVLRLKAAKYAIDGDGNFNETELPMDVAAIEPDMVPKKLIEMAMEKNNMLCANAARNEYRMIGDTYINGNPPESFLCMPVSAGDKVLGAVYLENASLPGAFPEGRVTFLQALINQASALIMNLQNVERMADYTKDLEKRLSSYLSQQNALIAGVAHEINSPVGVCLTVSTKIHEKTQAVLEAFGEKQLGKGALEKYLTETRDGLDIINNNITRAGDLVQNFKKMSVEQSIEVMEELELGAVLHDIVEYIRPAVKKSISSIELKIPEGLRLYTSNGILAQVFTNLIINSSNHAFEDKPREECQVEIVATDFPATDEVEIRYSDNGKGMNEEEREKVFQPFFTTKRNRGGSGLGGHIILTNVTQTLRGSIVCKSEPGQGTDFIIRLPKSAAKTLEGTTA